MKTKVFSIQLGFNSFGATKHGEKSSGESRVLQMVTNMVVWLLDTNKPRKHNKSEDAALGMEFFF